MDLESDGTNLKDEINQSLDFVTAGGFISPYVAFIKVVKTLALYHIHMQSQGPLNTQSGIIQFPISQFGIKVGMTNDGKVVTKHESPYTFYFEYRLNEKGFYSVYCEILDEEELEEIHQDVEEEMQDME